MNRELNLKSIQGQERLIHQLEIQSRQIEQVLSRNEMSAQISGGTVKPDAVRFNLRTQLSLSLERLRELAGELKQVLGVPEVSFSLHGGVPQLQLTRPADPPVKLLDLMEMLPDLAPGTAVLGLTDEGHPVLVDLRDPDIAHLLISGEPGSGKTALLRSIAVSLALANKQSQMQMMLLGSGDEAPGTSYTELEPLNYLPHMLAPVGYGHEEAQDLLTFLADELGYRRQQRVSTPGVILLIDEIVQLMEAGGAFITEPVMKLLQYGAEYGIHLILACERPEAPLLGELFMANLPGRVIGKTASSRSAAAASGISDSGAEMLLGKGDFLALMSDGETTRFQSAFIGEYDLHLTLDLLHRNRPRPILAQPFSSRASLKLELSDTHCFDYDGESISLASAETGPEAHVKPSAVDR